MTASIVAAADAASSPSSFGRLAGFRALARKDTTDWLRSRRFWVILAISVAFMVLTAANGWITNQLANTLPPGSIDPDNVGSMSPVDNFLASLSAQIFILATIFVAGSLFAREREAGTLAWIASKPVTRASIWLSKWVTTSAMTALVAAILPMIATAAVVFVLYGALPVQLVVGVAIGVVAVVMFFAAVGLALGTVIPGQAATIAAAFGVFVLMPIVAGISPFPIEPYLPTAMLGWPAEVLSGAGASLATPIAWFAITTAVVAFGVRRTVRMEL